MSFEGSRSWRDRDGDAESARKSVERQNLQNFFERQVELAARGENAAKRRLTEAETDTEIKDWERRNSEFALHESRRELESERFQLQQASQWADQAQREKISLCG